MEVFIPSDPNDRHKTQAELRGHQNGQKERQKQKRMDTIRFWITTSLSFIAAAAAVAGVLIQLASRQ